VRITGCVIRLHLQEWHFIRSAGFIIILVEPEAQQKVAALCYMCYRVKGIRCDDWKHAFDSKLSAAKRSERGGEHLYSLPPLFVRFPRLRHIEEKSATPPINRYSTSLSPDETPDVPLHIPRVEAADVVVHLQKKHSETAGRVSGIKRKRRFRLLPQCFPLAGTPLESTRNFS